MVIRNKDHLRYLLAALMVILTLGLTQCQSPSDHIAVTPAAKDEGIKSKAADTSTVNWKSAIAQVARDNIPSVVHIDVTQRREISNPMMPFGNDPFFHFFFNGPQAPRKFKQELRGLGTGMLIDDKGHILTNNHVVAGATEINVLLADGTSCPAKLVGTDPKTDLAVIRIAADEKLPAVTFGDSGPDGSRRLGGGHWPSPRARSNRYPGNHQRQAPSRRPRPNVIPGLSADRCGHQSRQQWRAADQSGGAGRWC